MCFIPPNSPASYPPSNLKSLFQVLDIHQRLFSLCHLDCSVQQGEWNNWSGNNKSIVHQIRPSFQLTPRSKAGRCRGESIAIHCKPVRSKAGRWGWSLSQYYLNFHLPSHNCSIHLPAYNLSFSFSIYWVQRKATCQTPLCCVVCCCISLLFKPTVPRFFSFDVTLHWRHENVMDNMKV